jgi:hypothetical protein
MSRKQRLARVEQCLAPVAQASLGLASLETISIKY